jgi:4-hydroxy-3-methylbut-2-enyl diphosphate reductase
MDETRIVCDYIENGGDAKAFEEIFSEACSTGFDPDRHLKKIGLANQTTMLSSESLAIEAALRESMLRRYGATDIEKRFRSFDTICSATQERQDAVIELVEEGVDVMVVIGGYNSSNTNHLAEISSRYCATYHISGSRCLVSAEEISHKPVGGKEATTRDWLPKGPVTIGITAGASTPDIKVDESISRILSFRGLSPDRLEPARRSRRD